MANVFSKVFFMLKDDKNIGLPESLSHQEVQAFQLPLLDPDKNKKASILL